MGRGGGPIEIDWNEAFGRSPTDPASPGRDDDVCFAALSPAPAPAAAGSKRGGGAGAGARRPQPRFEGLRRGREPPRRSVTRAAAAGKAGGGSGRGAHSGALKAFDWSPQDEQGEHASHKFCVKSSPVRRKKNYGQLGTKNERNVRHMGVGQRQPIAVDKMYSGKTCSATLSGHQQRVHAIDPGDSDHKRSHLSEKCNLSNYLKRRKEECEDLSPICSRKAEDVVLLDDEDMQPEEQVDPSKLNQSKIYFPSRDDPEAVELTGSDIKCLDPEVFLSSPVINFYIQYIKKNKLYKEGCRDKFYIFNTYFYSKLEEAFDGKGDFLKLRRWWKGVNIFHTAYIIIPIHGMSHWSLIIICIPAKESNSGPIILHLDSLEMHPSTRIFNVIRRAKPFSPKQGNEGRKTEKVKRDIDLSHGAGTSIASLHALLSMDSSLEMFQSFKFLLTDYSIFSARLKLKLLTGASGGGHYGIYLESEWRHLKKNHPPNTSISDSIWEDLPRNIHTENIQVPQQNNAYDCGIFMLYYIKKFIKEAPERLTRDKLNMFSRSWFNSEDASELRPKIQNLLMKEFELPSEVADGMSSMATSDRLDMEDSIKGGELEAARPSDSSEMIVDDVESGGTGKNNEGFKVVAAEEASGESGGASKSKVGGAEEASGEPGGIDKNNFGNTDVQVLDEATISNSGHDERTVDCVLSEAASFSDSIKDEETVNADSDSSKIREELFVISSPERSENNAEIVNSTPYTDVVPDSCDSDSDVKIIRVRKQKNESVKLLHKVTRASMPSTDRR
ncbi:hypothetical protein ACP4OV_022935 [Aristida adscensionis]